MMDIKEIIKWFIPCFHILLKRKLSKKFVLVCLFLLFNLVAGSVISSDLSSDSLVKELSYTKNLDLSSVKYHGNKVLNQSKDVRTATLQDGESTSADTSIALPRASGRTFGRPFMKKMFAGLLPIIFQLGAASTWAVVAAVVGVKTLLVTLAILKLLLLAGAANFGALFATKSHHHEPSHHQKEIHLHIHNNGHEQHEEYTPTWNREGYPDKLNYVVDPYKAGPQTISTPFGNYLRMDPSLSSPTSTSI